MTLEQQQSLMYLHKHLKNMSESTGASRHTFTGYVQALQALIREHDDYVHVLTDLRHDLRVVALRSTKASDAVRDVCASDDDLVCKMHPRDDAVPR